MSSSALHSRVLTGQILGRSDIVNLCKFMNAVAILYVHKTAFIGIFLQSMAVMSFHLLVHMVMELWEGVNKDVMYFVMCGT